MPSVAELSTRSSLGCSSIPIAVRKNNIATTKFVCTDADVRECPPEGDTAPVIAFPGDNATNKAVKAYLLDVLTRTGWGLAVESAQEIRATINSFVGNGWALRSRYSDKRLQNICPLQITFIEDGVAIKRKVSASVRSNIGKCMMHEMHRYFEFEKKVRDAGDGDDTLVSGARETGTSFHQRHDSTAESNELELQQFMKRPLSRSPLPDEWMSESLRARTRSRLSQHSEEQLTPLPRPIQFKQQPVFISRTSAYPMLVDITDEPRLEQSKPRESRPASRISNARPSMPKRFSVANPYHTIPGSSLPRPATAFGFRSVSQATYTSRPALESELVNETDNGVSPITVTLDALAEDKSQAQTEVQEVDNEANNDAEATSHATPSTDGHDDTANIVLTDEDMATLNPDDNDNAGDIVNATETDEHPTITSSDGDKSIENDAPICPAVEEPTEPLQSQPPMSPDIKKWIRALPSTPGPQPMPTLPPSPPNAYKVIPDELDAIAPGLPASELDAIGHIATINDIPVGSKTRRIAEREVEEARAQTEEATATRQQIALAKGKGRLRRWLRRVWGKVRMRKPERAMVAEETEGA